MASPMRGSSNSAPFLNFTLRRICLGVISGAILAHLTQLGIEVQGDGGYLFVLALVVFAGCGICLYLEKDSLKLKYAGLFAGR